MTNQPIQVVTNPSRLQQRRDKNPPNSAGTDFFEGDPDGFERHQRNLAMQIAGILQVLSDPAYEDEFGGLGYVRVRMRSRAIAKTHRPQKALFRKRATPHVATARVGEPIFACTPAGLREVLERLVRAEIDVAVKVRPDTGNEFLAPTRARCEASAIESVSLWSDADKRSFGADDAVDWLSRSGTGGRYEVDLFPMSGAGTQSRQLQEAGKQAVRALQATLAAAHVEGTTQPVRGIGSARSLNLGVVEGSRSGTLELGILSDQIGTLLRAAPLRDLSRNAEAHARVLHELGRNPLVRSVSLPSVVSPRPSSTAPANELSIAELPPVAASSGSIVGVIDGGVGAVLEPWVADRWGVIADVDIDAAHGTFISGLLVAAGPLNPESMDPTRSGCRVVDVNVLPADAGGTALFDRYYPGGTPQFLDEIDDAVKSMRERHGVRVFNLSINFDGPGDDGRYGATARRLDEIARAYDVIFVVSAGNLPESERRAEWSNDATATLAALARETRTTITEPAESLFNVAVAALNPPGLPGQVGHALARYSRRGPGLRGATKPDLAHIGGSGTDDAVRGSGLRSLDTDGSLVTGAGTSYAAPLVARELADLDAAIDGPVPRETLLALLIHDAEMPKALQRRPLDAVATDLAGFGVPRQTASTLERPDSEIVMVFNSTVLPGEEHNLTFAWPAALVDDGKCRGYARLTLVARPVLAYEHGDERIRVNIDAKLMQEQDDGGFSNALRAVHHPNASANPRGEKELLAEAHKWQVVKSFDTPLMRGRGKSSTWKFLVEYLTRAEEDLPVAGVEFAAVLTIADPKGDAPVFQQMRQQLGTLGIRTADIRSGVRTRVGV
ncbi:S8 family peptidase [Curtobacterium pusillum]|uniref:S8 family peptidase n=1 Tax=Curtobacterium pusillum TaxID=69373 RepID=UPI0011A17CDB|nr:S8 family peptidase [Curtobacterium pusillum]